MELATRMRLLGHDPRLRDVAARVVVVLAVIAASYWKIVDCETYMRLAIGRATAAAGLKLGTDPFLFSLPGLRWRNPEWLADLLLWGVYRASGETGLVVLKLVVFVAGWSMLYELARRRGGSPLMIVSLALVTLAGSEWHMSERNEMHLHWLVPAYGLVLDAGRRERRRLWMLLPLGVIWANLHGSFTIGWLLIGAELAESLFGEERNPGNAPSLAIALALQPLLPLCSPEGLHAYDIVIDHLRNGAAITRHIREWRPPSREAATLAQLPLHLLGLVGLTSFLPRVNRRQVGAFLVFAVGLYFAHRAQRFLLLFGLLSIPVIGANLTRAMRIAHGRGRPVAQALAAALAGLAILMFLPAVSAARQCPRASEQPDYPSKAAAWLDSHAPAQSRLFMPYTGSQWMMWLAPQVPLYIHPHFSFDTEHMIRFFEKILPAPARFDAEVQRFDINLALVDLVGESAALHAHLDGASDWQLVYFDGFYAGYARRTPRNADLIARSGYHLVRGRLGFDALEGANDAALAPELARLESEAPAVATALRGFRRLRDVADTAPAITRGEQARALLSRALPALPSSPALSSYLVEANVLAGDIPHARAVLEAALTTFPRSPRLRALAESLRVGP